MLLLVFLKICIRHGAVSRVMQRTNFAETNDERQDLLDGLEARLDRRSYNKCKGVDDGVDETGGLQEKISCLDVDVRCARASSEDRVVCS